MPGRLKVWDGTAWQYQVSPPASGGSQPVTRVYLPFSFDTPDLVQTGIPIYTPTVGDVWFPAQGYMTLATAFDGTTPMMHFGTAADLHALDGNGTAPDLTLADTPAVGGSPLLLSNFHYYGAAPVTFTTTDPLTAMVDDTADGDPGSTVGVGVFTLLIMKAAA